MLAGLFLWSLWAVFQALLLPVAASNSSCSAIQPSRLRPRVLILTDIANEPDDAESLVRLLVYSHQFRLQGFVATTSYWLNSSTHEDQIIDTLKVYGKVLPNLKAHVADGWPEAQFLINNTKAGLPVYGMDGVGEGKDSDGSELLIRSVDASDEPLWLPCWGGTAVLAQALWKVNATRSSDEMERFVRKLRVYAVSDQDNTGTWIRRNWPQLFYIASVHHFNIYADAAWSGIPGDNYYHYEHVGANSSVITKKWTKKYIQDVGELGAQYPMFDYIPEGEFLAFSFLTLRTNLLGDTPTFLYLIQNGLSDPEHPEWGSWGGRYGPVCYGEGHYADTIDLLTGPDGIKRSSSQATIWRWRSAYQADFAARMQWAATYRFEDANHPPVAVVNQHCGLAPVEFTMQPNQTIQLNASTSYDPDGDKLSFKWWQYVEPSDSEWPPSTNALSLRIRDASSPNPTITLPSANTLWQAGGAGGNRLERTLHLILEVNDGALVSYRRVLIKFNIPRT